MRILSISPAPMWDVEEGKGMPSIYLGHKAFVEAGHDVVFMVPGTRGRNYDYHGIRVYEFRVGVHVVPERYLWWHRLSLKVFAIVYVISASIRALLLSRSFRPDVVYGHFLYGAPVAWIVGRVRGIPNITRMYGTFLFPWVRSFWGRIRKFEEVLAFKLPCSYLIMTDDGTRGGDCAEILGVPRERLKLWRNGVDKDMYDPAFDKSAFRDSLSIPRNHKIIVAVSRLASWKRVDRLITAMPAILDRRPDTTAVIVGDGEERENLELMCLRLGVDKHVKFVGLVPHEEVGRFLNAADLFVSLYDISNAGNPLLEALCCGKCVVSLRNGSTGDINRYGDVAVLLDVTELDGLPDVVVDLLDDNRKREQLGCAARRYVDEHMQTWPERVQMEVELIENLVNSSGV